MRNFRRDALTAALEQRRVIQGTLLRSTIHMVSARDYWLFLSAVRMGRQEWWRRVTRKGFGEVDIGAAVPIFREALAAGPRRAADLKDLLARRGFPSIAWTRGKDERSSKNWRASNARLSSRVVSRRSGLFVSGACRRKSKAPIA